MTYARNLRPGMVVSSPGGTSWGVVERVAPFGGGDAHADVHLVGDTASTKMRVVVAARLTPQLRAVASSRQLLAERDQARTEVAELKERLAHAVDHASTVEMMLNETRELADRR